MKRIHYRLGCLFLILSCFKLPIAFGQRFDKTVRLEGRNREFIISKPIGAVPPGGYPVVVMLHGTTGNGELFYQTSGWKELGQQEKFISVFPSSLAYCVQEEGKSSVVTKWNNGDLQSAACPGQEFKDDVLFMRTVIDTLKSGFQINSQRIYFCGFSNGGVHTAKLAVEMSDIIAASVSASGILHSLDSGTIRPAIPCWLTIGTQDDRFLDALVNFNIRSIPYNDSALTLFSGILDNFTAGLGLQNQYTRKDSSTNLMFYEYSRLKNGEPASARFIFLLARNMFHVFPNGTNYPFFESAPLYWHFFFKNIVKSSTTPLQSVPTPNPQLKVYPNPAQAYIRIKSPFYPRPSISHIVDARGQLVKQVRIQSADGVIPVHDLPAGLYVLVSGANQVKFIKS